MTLYVYVDNSNIWIEGRRIQAVRQGLAPDVRTAIRDRLVASWTYDFGRLYELACPPGQQIGRSADRSCTAPDHQPTTPSGGVPATPSSRSKYSTAASTPIRRNRST